MNLQPLPDRSDVGGMPRGIETAHIKSSLPWSGGPTSEECREALRLHRDDRQTVLQYGPTSEECREALRRGAFAPLQLGRFRSDVGGMPRGIETSLDFLSEHHAKTGPTSEECREALRRNHLSNIPLAHCRVRRRRNAERH